MSAPLAATRCSLWQLVRRFPAVPGIGSLTTQYVTYTVTDQWGNANMVTLPIRTGRANTTPSLDPVSDMVVGLNEIRSFTVGLSDPDGDLNPSDLDTLRVDGLPATGVIKSTLRATPNLFVCRITIGNTGTNRGVYRVHIRGRDGRLGQVISQMRLELP